MYTIMHISDLHRSPSEPIGNSELVAALERDVDRFQREEPPIAPPDAIIVSGDLVRGAPMGATDPDDVLAKQYEDAEDLLGQLATQFLGSDRSRLVIVPGNHDVDWNRSRASMSLATPDPARSLRRDLATPDSGLRWDWDSQSVFQIHDRALYETRLDHYWALFDRFYGSCDGIEVPLDRADPVLYDLNDGRIVVAAFDSCTHNDCFRHVGGVDLEALSRSHLHLNKRSWEAVLRVAVWHHDTSGPPETDDYMSAEVIDQMIGFGFSLGFHGHRHRGSVIARTIRLPEAQSMAVVSAGSLAAGNPELPRGVNRQYNMVELGDDLLGARMHVREMEVATHFGPRRLNEYGGKSYTALNWEPRRTAGGAVADTMSLNANAVVLTAEKKLNENDAEGALEMLTQRSHLLSEYGRRLLGETADGLAHWEVILKHLSPPTSPSELAVLAKAYVKTGDHQGARELVELDCVRVGCSEPQCEELLEWIAGEENLA